MSLNLQRESAMLPLEIGAEVRVTHLKDGVYTYGYTLQSTHYTVLEVGFHFLCSS